MLGSLVALFGGGAFRAIWGEVSSWLTKKQDHTQELERMKIEAESAASNHVRELERIRLQVDLGAKQIQLTGDIDREKRLLDIEELATKAWAAGQERAGIPTGVKFIDGWNGAVRPAYATVALTLWVLALWMQDWHMTAFDTELVCAIIGFFFADRALGKRGK